MFERIDEIMQKHAHISPGRLVSRNDMKDLMAETIGSMTTAPIASIRQKTVPAGKVLGSEITGTAQGLRAPKKVTFKAVATSNDVTVTLKIGTFEKKYVAESIARVITEIRGDQAVQTALDAQ